MWLPVDTRSSTPIYQQIVDAVKEQTARGALEAGDRMPSIRELAVNLMINPNTIAKAYQELERAGIIEVVRGRGTYVARRMPQSSPHSLLEVLRIQRTDGETGVDVHIDSRYASLLDHMRVLLVEAFHLGIPVEELATAISVVAAEWKEGGANP